MTDGSRPNRDQPEMQREVTRRPRSRVATEGACTDATSGTTKAQEVPGESQTSLDNLFGDYSEQTGAFFG